MRKLYYIIGCLIVLVSLSEQGFSQSFAELQKIPRDSINAEQMKIWVPVEVPKCSVKVKIYDSENNLIRDLLNKKLYKGYYNLYWDKKDDSGKYVAEGVYNAAVSACKFKRTKPKIVNYQDGENISDFTIGSDSTHPSFDMQLHEDSVVVSLEIYNNREFVVDSLLSDSLFALGKHNLEWQPKKYLPTGTYYYKLSLNGFNHWIQFRYKR